VHKCTRFDLGFVWRFLKGFCDILRRRFLSFSFQALQTNRIVLNITIPCNQNITLFMSFMSRGHIFIFEIHSSVRSKGAAAERDTGRSHKGGAAGSYFQRHEPDREREKESERERERERERAGENERKY
jgi:hypothetical protein